LHDCFDADASPCCSIRRFVISPRPVPCGFVVNG
jgi:hypothetical protein